MAHPDPRSRQARALLETVGVHRLDRRILEVRGDDARTWLNGQITADVGTLAPAEARYGLVVSLKGRVLADLWVIAEGERFLLSLPALVFDAIVAHFDKYIIMEDVELHPRPTEVVLSVQGPLAAQVSLRADGLPRLSADWLGVGGYDVIVPAEEAEAFEAELVRAAEIRGGVHVSDEGWELARIRAGRPRFGADFGEETYPQEAGLATRAVSFGKGCYQGQEAVVMLEHRGKPPRRLVRVAIVTDLVPEPRSPVVEEAGTTVGTITSAVLDPEFPGVVDAFALLRRERAEVGQKLRVAGADATVQAIL